MTLINVFLERYTMNITAFMIFYHHSVPVFPIYDPRAILLNYLGVHQNYIKNLFSPDVCLNMCNSAIRYVCSSTSVYIFLCSSVSMFTFFFIFLYFFLYHVYFEVVLFGYQCIYVCYMFIKDQSINQSISYKIHLGMAASAAVE